MKKRRKGNYYDLADFEQAKIFFELGTKKKLFLSFEELYKMFSNDCVSFTAIAKKAKVTREAVRQTYNSSFKWLFPHRQTGHKRQMICTRKRLVVTKKSLLASNEDDSPAARVLNKINQLGMQCSRELTVSKYSPYVKKNYLTVEGKLCLAREVHSEAYANRRRNFYQVSLRLVNTDGLHIDFFLYSVLVENQIAYTYVIPYESLPRHRSLENTILYIPREDVKLSEHSERRRKYTWAQYKDAWYLFS